MHSPSIISPISSSLNGNTPSISKPYKFEEIHIEEISSLPSQNSGIHYGQHEKHSLPQQHYVQQYQHNNFFAPDNGLRGIAKSSADQANTAVVIQNSAAKQAAYMAKNTLAHTATQAAGTAVAVFKGKEVLLKRLEEQSAEMNKVLQSELQQLQQAKRSAKAAQYAAQQALNHVYVLSAALNNAQNASKLSQKSASEAAIELASQIDMVAQAKAKLEQIEFELYNTRLDYEETRNAAEKATLSAQEAQLNANDAALHANFEHNESTHKVISKNSGFDQHKFSDGNDYHTLIKRFNSNNNISNLNNESTHSKNQ